MRMSRPDIKNAEYNARTIDKFERSKLLKVLKRGLLQSLTWNKQTGNLVSGHQRLSILDDLMGTDQYALDMDVVDLSLKDEIKANIAFNNETAMGRFDDDKLAKLLLEDIGLAELEDTGFTVADMHFRFDETQFAGMFAPEKQAPTIAGDVAEMNAVADASRAADKSKESTDDSDGNPEVDHIDPVDDTTDELTPQEIAKRNRDKMRQDHLDRETDGMGDADTNLHFVFGTREERMAIQRALDVSLSATQIDGRRLALKLGVELPTKTSI